MLTVPEIRALFKIHGLSPKKWMGQNLLVDPNYLRKIVHAAGIAPGEVVVEVGAGLGVLTEALENCGARVYAIEVDAGFVRVLHDRFAGSSQVEVIHADALKLDFRSLAERIGRLRVVANLPYSISSRLIFSFYEERELFRSLHILLQKEVAERILAGPGTKEYGILSVLLGVTARTELLFQIPGSAFFPAPEVLSSMVCMVFPDPPPVPVADVRLLTRLVKASFAGRRKTLGNSLRRAPIPGLSPEVLTEAARKAGVDLRRRAETLTPSEFAHFSDVLREIGCGSGGSPEDVKELPAE